MKHITRDERAKADAMRPAGNRRARSGFSLVELVVVIIIIGILGAVGVGFGGRQIANARMSTITNNIQILSSDVESAVLDVGFLDNVTDDAEVTKKYFSTWDSRYLTSPIALTDIVIVEAGVDNVGTDAAGIEYNFGDDYSGVKFETKGYADPWQNEIRFFYLVPTDGEMYRIVIASAGPNGYFAESSVTAYLDGEFDDDIVMVMEPRG